MKQGGEVWGYDAFHSQLMRGAVTTAAGTGSTRSGSEDRDESAGYDKGFAWVCD